MIPTPADSDALRYDPIWRSTYPSRPTVGRVAPRDVAPIAGLSGVKSAFTPRES